MTQYCRVDLITSPRVCGFDTVGKGSVLFDPQIVIYEVRSNAFRALVNPIATYLFYAI